MINKFIYIACFLSYSLVSYAQAIPTPSWSEQERIGFKAECLKSAGASLSKEKAELYCDCALEYVEYDYPDPQDAADHISQEYLQEVAKTCLTAIEDDMGGGGWTNAERTTFMSECEKGAINELGADGAEFYCSCMLGKIEYLYPNAEDAQEMTIKAMTDLAKDCMPKN